MPKDEMSCPAGDDRGGPPAWGSLSAWMVESFSIGSDQSPIPADTLIGRVEDGVDGNADQRITIMMAIADGMSLRF